MSGSDFINPFSDYGNIVHGSRFINRSDSIRAVENRVLRPKEAGNLAVIGDYRIGKSSLVYKSIMDRKDDLLREKRLPIWINLATFDQASSFFRSLVSSSYDELDSLEWVTSAVKSAAERVLRDEVSWGDGYGRIQRYFEKIRQAEIRILFILDEFDHARYLFRGNISGFQGLRELSYRPEWRVTFITTSRRSLQSIELQTQAISTLDHTFHKHYLGMFDENAIEEYFERLSSVGINVTQQVKEKISSYCGGHPYLLEMLGYELVEMFRETRVQDIDRAMRQVNQSFLVHYDHMRGVLEESNALSKILQVLFGPAIDVRPTDTEELQKYGLIKNNEAGYIAFSEHFQDYLKMIYRQIDLWPLWRETEIALRRVITDKMMKKYGEQWIEALCKAASKLRLIFEKCKEAQQKEENSFGSRASRNLIDFTYPQDLFSIIFAEWREFEVIFGKDKNYWNQRVQLLAKIRNPLAHNRDQALYDYERQTVEGYCKEILAILEAK